ncbi:hypothetical protein [Candidatus Caldatribacterium sp.]|uniref:hypothetical protein n=1 Tax=Candidatus Caldatribacterium sp. TaxID=2282143 RepID=UPI0038474875|nr:hypothetical protein [Candidatus Caldatribacterium sp.]
MKEYLRALDEKEYGTLNVKGVLGLLHLISREIAAIQGGHPVLVGRPLKRDRDVLGNKVVFEVERKKSIEGEEILKRFGIIRKLKQILLPKRRAAVYPYLIKSTVYSPDIVVSVRPGILAYIKYWKDVHLKVGRKKGVCYVAVCVGRLEGGKPRSPLLRKVVAEGGRLLKLIYHSPLIYYFRSVKRVATFGTVHIERFGLFPIFYQFQHGDLDG